ncbi:MAG: hypothetical protein K6G18_06340 [Treponema sp.]|nr:hypothetical protein [Treponema sp.]
MSDVALAYKSLDRSSQIEIENLVFKLVAKQENESAQKQRTHEENVALVKSFMGRSHSWNGGDVLEYQRQLRGEYRENV